MLQLTSPATHADLITPTDRPGPTVALIPAYNESRFIGSLILAVLPLVDRVVVVDDGSADGTAELARRAGAEVVQHPVNQGKTAAVNTGFAYALRYSPAAVVMLDGDGQHCAADIPAVLGPILAGEADIVVGSRFLDVHSAIPAYRRVGQHGLTLATNLASGVPLSDSQSGFRAFSRQALAELCFGGGGFSVESEMQFLAREHGLRLCEVPIRVIYAEPPKRDPVRHGLQVVHAIVNMVGQSRPLFFFTLMGMPTIAASMLLGVAVLRIYALTNQLAVGYALVTVLLSIVGIILFFTGVILHSTRGMLIEMRKSLIERVAREGRA